MGEMKETMDFINSFMPETFVASLLIFAGLFWLKYNADNKKTEKLEADKNL